MPGIGRLIGTAVLALGLFASGSAAPVKGGGSAAGLRAAYEKLRPELEHSAFGKPLHLTSSQSGDRLTGDVHAVLDQPFDTVRQSLANIRNWCDILLLHPNVAGCRVAPAGQALTIFIGKQETPADFAFAVASATPEYLNVELQSDDGPLGTSDYHIRLEAAPLDGGRSIMRLVYSYSYGLQARLAMRAYLATFGRGKVGFTVVGQTPEGKPVYVDDYRGALERNAMRYYLCIEAYLSTLLAPPAARYEKRLQAFYAYTERYPLQLREDGDYLARKRSLAPNAARAASSGS